MTTNYPTSIDIVPDPTATNKLNSPSHSSQHSFENDAIEALETKVGINSSSDTNSIDYKLSGITGADKALGTNSLPKGTTSVYGAVKTTTATDTVISTDDTRISTQGENDAQVGDNTDIAIGTGNKFVSQTGLQHNAEKYAVDAQATDTYQIALSPIPTAYTDGMVVHFKAKTINTGVATLNVNSLGAKNIVKYVNTTLADGDILAGMFCTVIYDLTNTQWILQNPIATVPLSAIPLFKNGTDIKNASDASIVQNIAHGLGVIPKKIRISAIGSSATTAVPSNAFTVYNGVTQSSISAYGYINDAFVINSFCLTNDNGNAGTQVGVVTFDATNIIITWTKSGAPTGSYVLLWEANT